MSKPIKILIVEDELLAAKRLERIISELPYPIEIIDKSHSVASTVKYLKTNPEVDLLLMDIKLGDGLSLDILEQVDINKPIIFTTAFDDYTLKAFKLHSVDYLLKPIDPDELTEAIKKYIHIYRNEEKETTDLKKLITQINGFRFKERFLVKSGNHLIVIQMKDISYFFTSDGYTHLVTNQGKKHIIDDSIETVQKEIDPQHFFRINRSMLISLSSIKKMEQYFNSRYILSLEPNFQDQVIVSRERVKEFKEWLEK